MAKKKKEQDFKKVKLKVGRKLVKGNETKTEFKAKKLVLKEAKSLAKDPVGSLITCSLNSNSQLKLLCLSKVTEGCLLVNHKLITGELMNAVSRYLIDGDHRVRSEARKCAKQAILSLENRGQPLGAMLALLLSYLRCGLTHIDANVCSDSRKMLEFVIEKSLDSALEEDLMGVMLSRFTSAGQPDVNDLELAAKLTEAVWIKRKAVKTSETRLEWDRDVNCFFNINKRRFEPCLQFNISFQSSSAGDSKQQFTSVISDLVSQEMRLLSTRKQENWSLTATEARKVISVIKICKAMRCFSLPIKGKTPQVSVTVLVNNTQQTKKQLSAANGLQSELTQLLSSIFLA